MMRVTKWLFSFWCLWACVATALADEDMPYVRTQEVSADAKIVRLFFMFSCPHCHSADKALASDSYAYYSRTHLYRFC